jgi:hypothetical protein
MTSRMSCPQSLAGLESLAVPENRDVAMFNYDRSCMPAVRSPAWPHGGEPTGAGAAGPSHMMVSSTPDTYADGDANVEDHEATTADVGAVDSTCNSTKGNERLATIPLHGLFIKDAATFFEANIAPRAHEIDQASARIGAPRHVQRVLHRPSILAHVLRGTLYMCTAAQAVRHSFRSVDLLHRS